MVFKYCVLNLMFLVTVITSELNVDSADYSREATTTSRPTTIQFLRNHLKYMDRKIYLKPNEILVGEAIHELVGKNSEFTKQVTKFENAYRGYLRMEGVKYTFKRDGFWKTWRPVRYPDEKDHAVYYKCMASKDEDDNNADCQKSGYWDIEEKMHDCPFEIFGMNNKKFVCGLSFQSIRSQQHCPNELSFEEIRAKCPSTIVTRMRFTKHFDKKYAKSSPKALCGGKQSCDVTTLYQINSTQILFQIINADNDIIFSKLMKPNKHNYVCMKSCGNTLGKHLSKDDIKAISKAKSEIKKTKKMKTKTYLVAKPKINTKTIKLSKKTGKPLKRYKRAALKHKTTKNKKRITKRASKTLKSSTKSKTEVKSKTEAKTNTGTTLKPKKAKPTKETKVNSKAISKTKSKIVAKSTTKAKVKPTKETRVITNVNKSKNNSKIIKREAKTTKNITPSRKPVTKKRHLRNAKNKKSKVRPRSKRNIKTENKGKYEEKHKKATEKKKINLKEFIPDHRNRNIMSPELKKYFDKLDVKKQKKYGGEDTKKMKSYIKRYLEVHPFFNN